MSKTGYEEAAEVLPELDTDGRYFWQPFAERVQNRFEGLPGLHGTASFADECLRAGAQAVPVIRRNSLWEKDAPESSKKRARGIYELRIRLGLFYAASLRSLVQGVSRLRVRCADAEWHAVTEEGQAYQDFAAGQEDKVEVLWTNAAADFGEACLVTQVFFTVEEALLLTPTLAKEVYRHVGPDGPAGLFGMMLAADGQADKVAVDVAGVFLEALAEAVDRRMLPVNTRVNGQVFVTPEFWLLTSPGGVGDLLGILRTRRHGRRYDFPRHEVFRALHTEGHLAGVEASERGNAVRIYGVDVIGWDKPLELHGLAIKSQSLPVKPNTVPLFDGTVTFKREIDGGNDQG